MQPLTGHLRECRRFRNRWRATENKTANSYVIGIAVKRCALPQYRKQPHAKVQAAGMVGLKAG
jgi:hypothetical protein